MRAQLIERPPAGGEELAEMSGNFRFRQVEPEVEIVNEQEVDTIHAEPHLRLLVGAHDFVVAVIVHVVEVEFARPRFSLKLVRLGRREEPTADFGRQNKFGPRLRVEETTATKFGQTPAVIGRGIVVANAGVPRRFECCSRRRFVEPDKELAERRAAETQLRDLHLGLSELPLV